ncbi:MAG: ATP-binding protein [Sporolactobacillus sp.]
MISKFAQRVNLIPVTEHAHILYVYDREEDYIKNVISFTGAAIEQNNHVLLIEKESLYKQIKEKLSHHYTAGQLNYLLFSDVQSLSKTIEECTEVWDLASAQLIRELDAKRTRYSPLRLWVHMELPERGSIPIIQFCKRFSENRLRYLDMMYVSAFNGHRISAAFENSLRKYYEYFMTDTNYVMSNLFDAKAASALTFARQQTKQKAERLLASIQRQLELFINQNPDPIIILNKSDDVVSVNQAYSRLFGWTEEEIRGLSGAQLPDVPQNHLAEIRNDCRMARLKKNIPPYESIRQTKSGALLHISVTGYPLLDENGDMDGRVIVLHDVTTAKRAKEMLIKTEKLSVAGELAAGIAHEIRNPITAIKGFLQLLKYGESKNNTYIDIMGSEIERVETILNELLLLAKPQTPNFQKQNLIKIVNDAVTLMKGQASIDKIDLRVDCDIKSILLLCDKNQLKQVFINLIKNAIEATSKGGTITVCVKLLPEELLIQFIDRGSGISEKIFNRIGEPFFTTKEKGTGLGFMVSREIIKSHHGTLHFFSRKGKGTTVEVHLPCSLCAESKNKV